MLRCCCCFAHFLEHFSFFIKAAGHCAAISMQKPMLLIVRRHNVIAAGFVQCLGAPSQPAAAASTAAAAAAAKRNSSSSRQHLRRKASPTSHPYP
jgi:hypothetical protein